MPSRRKMQVAKQQAGSDDGEESSLGSGTSTPTTLGAQHSTVQELGRSPIFLEHSTGDVLLRSISLDEATTATAMASSASPLEAAAIADAERFNLVAVRAQSMGVVGLVAAAEDQLQPPPLSARSLTDVGNHLNLEDPPMVPVAGVGGTSRARLFTTMGTIPEAPASAQQKRSVASAYVHGKAGCRVLERPYKARNP